MKDEAKKESQIYLSFLSQNILFLLIPLLIGALGGYIFTSKTTDKFDSQMLLQMRYEESNLRERSLLTDQATTVLRYPKLQEDIGVNSYDKVTIFKSGPVAISLSSESVDAHSSVANLEKIETYAKSNYPIDRVSGVTTEVLPKPYLKNVFMFSVIGFSFGLILSLIKTYLRNN